MAYIEINHLTKKIKNATVLDDIQLSLSRNQIYGFVGRNGSGKTMLFKAISGLIRPTQGSITIDGGRVGDGDAYPVSIGVMIENVGLWPYLSAMENLQALASIRRVIARRDVADAIRRVGLNPDDKKTFGKFSLGMKQRLVLAQAIMEKPELLVLDEPTNAIDADGVDLVKQIIREEVERGATVLLASHSMEDFDQFCDTVYPMKQGKLV